ncbi:MULTISPECIES: DUF1800 family protein [unclassified Burkholderia]|uniref:DUF1800 domain-containing protein n=1 Tax=unclassified Burkholderia TaxID=2613784 RepID=UPI000F5811BD|nr:MULTISPECIES: DUF1800 domain-containing protein [unclassified Burkholderia]RQR40009.1 DUF1800 domain-containing protein [Burkholderia sp. Bp9131]RQR68285.1 DUF1800 domain-containing protein [Burkholderia sp. Bp9015]RQR96411.1 DUF1800 domain-containing protein [Burkholderia sp. Bp8994]RQS25778.1 DUF1800 domain-containing protein [Burkholderia sp. Bp8995]RQS44243.1 DUF1800 domain-containing protein [Burkholderia sp. Bp8989]
MDHPNDISPAAIALNRFGLGARADDAPPADPKAALVAQLDRYDPRPAAWAGEPDAITLATRFATTRNTMTSDDAAARRATAQSIRRDGYDAYRSAVAARLNNALATSTPFVERLVHFWANHFAVSVDKGQVAAYAGAFERDAIRPHVLGRFEDMLVAVEQHPAMQLFLDQARSVGPDSPAALRADARNPAARRGLNENLAREIMELHTLGVRTGYTQTDVTEFARALTGWSIAGGRGPQPGDVAPGAFVFRPKLHEPGARTVMSRTYDQPGDAQARAILGDLARSPATGRHVAFQLARHFVADDPPPALTDRLARAFDTSGGDLPTVYRALVDAPDAWSPVNRKFKTPWEWAVSSLRGLGWRDTGDLKAAPLLAQLGQPVWRPGSPAGYDDVAASWAAPDALVRRVEIAQRFAARTGDRLDPRTLGKTLLAGSLSAPTATALSRAESATTSLALLLVSPDFQRR